MLPGATSFAVSLVICAILASNFLFLLLLFLHIDINLPLDALDFLSAAFFFFTGEI